MRLYETDQLSVDCDEEASLLVFNAHGPSTMTEIQCVTTRVVNYIRSTSGKVRLHIHVLGENVRIDVCGIMVIVSKLVEHHELIKQRLGGTCVQVRTHDDFVDFVKNTLLKHYTPVAPFYIAVGDADAETFWKSITV